MTHRWLTMLCAGVMLAVAAAGAHAQQRPTYKCKVKGKVTYQHTACEGGVLVEPKPKRTATKRGDPPPQDRAFAARRAQLTPEARKECESLDVTIPPLEDGVKAKGAAATPEDERSLTEVKKRYRELKCH